MPVRVAEYPSMFIVPLKGVRIGGVWGGSGVDMLRVDAEMDPSMHPKRKKRVMEGVIKRGCECV